MVRLRVLTALGLAALLLLAVFGTPPTIWGFFVALIVVLSGIEWFVILGVNVRVATILAALCASPAAISGWASTSSWWVTGGLGLYCAGALFWLCIVPWALSRRPGLSGFAWRYIAGFIVLMSASFALVDLRSASPWLLLASMAPVWVSDISAFFVGRRWGRRKLAPSISPAKSWEGVGGAVVGVLVYAALLSRFVPAFSERVGLPQTLFLALFLTVLGILGDLFESLMKRQAGVKDSGTLLPGHGGMLDRVDSLLSTLPFAAAFLMIYRFGA